jgi:hypothetical protein
MDAESRFPTLLLGSSPLSARSKHSPLQYREHRRHVALIFPPPTRKGLK